MTHEMQSMLADSATMFIQLFLELSVLFLVISYLVSLANQKLPEERVQRLLGARKGQGYLTAAALGAVTPFCSCSTIPMLIGLLRARAGFGPTMTFLFTSPLLNPIVVALFIPVLGLEFTLWYAALALSASIVAGLLLERLGFERYVRREMIAPVRSGCTGERDPGVSTACGTSPDVAQASACGDGAAEKTACRADAGGEQVPCCGEAVVEETPCCAEAVVEAPSTWRLAWRDSWSLFRTMFPYMAVAMLIGAFVHGFVPADFFARVASADNPAAVPTAALVGIPLYVRVTTLLPLVGPFVAKGVSLGAVVALVIGSGGASLPELIMLKRLFLWPMILAFLGVIFAMAVIGGYTFNLFLA